MGGYAASAIDIITIFFAWWECQKVEKTAKNFLDVEMGETTKLNWVGGDEVEETWRDDEQN